MLHSASSHSDLNSAKSSAKNRKARRAAAQAAAEGKLAQPPSPIVPSDSAVSLDSCVIGEDGAHRNPYIEAINKRLRTLKKRLVYRLIGCTIAPLQKSDRIAFQAKIEKYEQSDKNELNADQVAAIEKKPEVLSAYKEFEEVLKQLGVVELEEFKASKAQQRAQEAAKQAEINQAVQNAKGEANESIRELIKLLHLWDVPLANSAPIPHSLTEDQVFALAFFRAKTTGAGEEGRYTVDSLVDQSEHYLKKYLERSKEDFYRQTSYADVYNLISDLLYPPAPPKFGQDEHPHAESEEASVKSPVKEDAADAHEQTPSGGANISFFNPSEVLGVEQVVTEEVQIKTEVEPDDTIVETVVETVTVVTTTDLEVPADKAEVATAEHADHANAVNGGDASHGDGQINGGRQQFDGHRGGGRGGFYRGGRGRGNFRGHQNGGPRGGYRNGPPRQPSHGNLRGGYNGQQGGQPNGRGPQQPRPQHPQ
ncbi:hypothetical protein HK097_006883 [Rhizophlyctis rosea]|uniref:Uncharacterized protein n=1 Tax=Rhizophlyctis rosea TaxID=64517 RepID=A0AAD5X5L3_9FUNG|nr:hypothetical protein HK097_006883 [Rhizophlyctis rosea]